MKPTQKHYKAVTTKDTFKNSPYWDIIEKEEKTKWRQVKIFLWLLYHFLIIVAFMFKAVKMIKDILFMEIKFFK